MNSTDTQRNSAAVPVVMPEPSSVGERPTQEHGRDVPSPLVSAGSQLGPFRLVSVLGRGGMGTVWRAEDTVLHRPVALKFLSVTSADSRERFLREARLAAGLNHPNIVTVHHVGEHDGVPFIVTELVSGGSLDSVVGKGGPLPPVRAAKLILQAARALEHAHSAHIVHRDVKPGNMLLTADGNVKVGDFGLARSLNDPGHLTTPGMVVGTPQYLAPELCTGGAGGPSGDIYALGCTFYYLLTGRRPFEASNTYEYLLKHVNEPLPDVQTKAPGVPDNLAKILKRACEKDPAYRYGSAAAMAVDLEMALAELGEGSGSGRPISSVGAAGKPAPGSTDTGSADKDAGGGWTDPFPPEDDTPDQTDRTEGGTPMSDVSERDRTGIRNIGVFAGLGLAALFVWFVGAVFQRWPADTIWEDGLHPFHWDDVRGGRVLAYMYWLAFAGLAVGPLIARLGRRFGTTGYVTGILLGLDVGFGASMTYWGPMPGVALLSLGLIPALILMAIQSREDHGFSWFGAALLAGAGALLTLAVAPDQAPVLGGLFEGRLRGDAIQWWHYVAFSLVPALLTFLPTVIVGIFDVPFLRRGRLQTGLGVCLLASMFIWGPTAGLLLPLIPLSLIGGTMAVLDIG